MIILVRLQFVIDTQGSLRRDIGMSIHTGNVQAKEHSSRGIQGFY